VVLGGGHQGEEQHVVPAVDVGAGGPERGRHALFDHAGALEESEHKSVAFDVYKAVGGGERRRVWTMNFFRCGFVLGMGLAVVLSLLRDRKTYGRGVLRKSWKRIKVSPIMDPALWTQLKDYNRPDFHPDDSDTTELVATWRAKLFGEDGTLNDKLVGVGAAA
jgi:uncharacterized protein